VELHARHPEEVSGSSAKLGVLHEHGADAGSLRTT
jgi:hypothetical protein